MSRRLSLRRCRWIGNDICGRDTTVPFVCQCWTLRRTLWRRALAKRKAKRGWRPGR